MKKLTTIIAALVLFFSASAFTNTSEGDEVFSTLFIVSNSKTVNSENVITSVTKSFNAKFANAADVSWKQNDDLYFARFVLNDKNFTAAYSDQGEMIALSRMLLTDQLPLVVLASLEEKYQEYKLPTNVTEIVMQGSTSYYLTVEGKTHFLQLKCSPEGSINVDKKMKKKVLVGSVL